MIFEGAGEATCSRQARAKGRPAWTLISCLVQPCGCNPARKTRRRPKAESTGSEGNDEKEEKNLLRRGSAY